MCFCACGKTITKTTDTFLGVSLDFENARPRSGFPRSRLELGHWEKGYLSVVESGDRRGRNKSWGNSEFAPLGDFGAIFLHLDAVSEQGAETQAFGKYCRSVS